jgi:nicotinate-nucleotide adenylyltransferase
MIDLTRRLGLFGGTFDPIHCGHLEAAEAARTALGLDEIWLIPSRVPPHRLGPVATPFHRFALAALAIADRPSLRVSDIELQRDGRTYTIDTLRALHARGWRSTQLFFMLGTDAFAEIATWREFPTVLDAAHFVVIARPGTTVEQALARTPELGHRAAEPAEIPVVGGDTRVIVLRTATPDVASTAIRQRLRAGQSLHGLVPPAVERHILTHHLYDSVGDLHGESTGTLS